MREYAKFAVEKTLELLAIDSPTGFTHMVDDYVEKEFQALGYATKRCNKGGIIIDLGGEDVNDGLLLQAHADTLGGMVAEIKGNGRLRILNLGGMNANNIEGENCRVYTMKGDIYEGTFQLCNASLHMNPNYSATSRKFDVTEVVLDELVESAEDTKALGIRSGDFVCFETRSRVTENVFIKSRFLDDKLSLGILIAFAKYLKDKELTPTRRLWVHSTVYEEVGHGGSASVPEGVTEVISVDMGCLGDGLTCTERIVSFCAKDSHGPYSHVIVKKMVQAAEKEGADYAVDVYPSYGSDADCSVTAGYDVRHGVMGPGVYVSHGYERSHMDGVENTLKVLKGYLNV